MIILGTQDILQIHKNVISPNELQGLAPDKSLDATLTRVENRIRYGMIRDEYDLAACYAVVIAVGHMFNDANKRTVFRSMDICLQLNGIFLKYDTVEMGQTIINVAQKRIDEIELAYYLRSLQ